MRTKVSVAVSVWVSVQFFGAAWVTWKVTPNAEAARESADIESVLACEFEWGQIRKLWDAYLLIPRRRDKSDALLSALKRASKVYFSDSDECAHKGEMPEFFHSHLAGLDRLYGDPTTQAMRVAFALKPMAEGPLAEDIEEALGDAFDRHPVEFLRTLDRAEGGVKDCAPATTQPISIEKKPREFLAHLHRRESSLRAVKDPALSKVRDLCLREVNAMIPVVAASVALETKP